MAAKIPFSAGATTAATIGGPRETAETVGGGLASALTVFNDEVAVVAKDLQEKRDRESNLYADNKLSEYQLAQMQRSEELQISAEAGAPNYFASRAEELKTLRPDMLNDENLTPEARMRLERGLINTNQAILGNAAKFERGARVENQKQMFQSSLNNYHKMVYTAPDIGVLDGITAQMRESAQTALPDMTAAQINEVMLEQEQALADSAFKGRLSQADSYLDAIALVQEMEGEGSPWQSRMSAEGYVNAVDAARRNEDRQLAITKRDDAEAESLVSSAQSSRFYELQIQVLNGEADMTDVENFRKAAMAKPEETSRQMLSLYTALDRVTKQTETDVAGDVVAGHALASAEASLSGDVAAIQKNIDAITQDTTISKPQQTRLLVDAYRRLGGMLDQVGRLTAAEQKAAQVGLEESLKRGATEADAAKDYNTLFAIREMAGDMHEKGHISDKGFTAIHNKTFPADAYKVEVEMASVENAYADPKMALDPDNKDHIAAVETHYGMMVMSEEYRGLPIEAQARFTSDYVQRVGIVPKQVISDVKAKLNSNDPATVVGGALAYEALRGSKPSLQFHRNMQFSSGLTSYANDILEQVHAGASPKDAFDWVTTARSKTPEERSGLQKAFRNYLSSTDAEPTIGYITDNTDFDKDEPNLVNMAREMDTLTETIYEGMAVPDIERARELALLTVEGSWGPSYTGKASGRLTKFPPENFYSRYNDPERDGEWITEQMRSDIETFVGTLENFVEISGLPEGYTEDLVITRNPYQSNNGRPVYTVTAIDERGASVVVHPAWFPQWESSEDKVRDDEIKTQAILDARAEREAALLEQGAPLNLQKTMKKVREQLENGGDANAVSE